MPVADYKIYCAILDRARTRRFGLPAVNVTSLTTANAVLRGLAKSKADGINLSLQENLDISATLLERLVKNELVLEIETGAVGGEEDDVVGDHAAELYTTPEDTLEVAHRLNSIGGGYLLAAVSDLRGTEKTMFAS